MPYVKQTARTRLLADKGPVPENAGELNYMISMLCLRYLQYQDTGYTSINDVLGALEGAKLEFYRRYASPYEDWKAAENGDIYGAE